MTDEEYLKQTGATVIHACKSPGLTMEGVEIMEVNSCNGQRYWKAVQPIGSIFGHEVDGEISAIGSTKEQALEHLSKERNNLYESLWM